MMEYWNNVKTNPRSTPNIPSFHYSNIKDPLGGCDKRTLG